MSEKLESISFYLLQVIGWTAIFSLGSFLIRFNLDYLEIAAPLGAFAGATMAASAFAHNYQIVKKRDEKSDNFVEFVISDKEEFTMRILDEVRK